VVESSRVEEELSETLISFCQRLIQTPSVNGEHPERPVAELVASFAVDHGLQAELVGEESARPNVRVWSTHETSSLLLVAHLDTVPVGTEANWTYGPFQGRLVDGKIFGRGAVDNKGGVAAAIGALLLLRDENAGGDGSAMFIGVPDEESGALGELGVKYLHREGKLVGRGAIYTYPGTDKIVLGHRGLVRMRLVTSGRSLHTGSREWQEGEGCNALTGLAEILLRVEGLSFRGPGPHEELFRDWRTLATPTIFHAGSGPSIGPDHAEALIDIRLTPDVGANDVRKLVQEVIDDVARQRPGLEVSFETIVDLPSTLITPEEPVVAALRTAAAAETGHDPALVAAGPANESYLLNGYGVPTVAFGPDGSDGHRVDEYVLADSLAAVAGVYARTARLLAAA
jgi:succinyl-diaminopimelate desuccinylase